MLRAKRIVPDNQPQGIRWSIAKLHPLGEAQIISKGKIVHVKCVGAWPRITGCSIFCEQSVICCKKRTGSKVSLRILLKLPPNVAVQINRKQQAL